ncbi:MAG: Ig-like domain-containing protein [Limosilactobacillus pontis]
MVIRRARTSSTSSDPNQVSPKITVDLLNGVTDKPLQNGESLDQYTPIRFELNYDLSGTNVYPGNYFTFSLPDTLKFTGKLNFKTNLGRLRSWETPDTSPSRSRAATRMVNSTLLPSLILQRLIKAVRFRSLLRLMVRIK